MKRHITPALVAAALLMAPVAAFALDSASAGADQGQMATNGATGTVAPRPIKKKLHHTFIRKPRDATTRKHVAVMEKHVAAKRKHAAAVKRKATPTAAGEIPNKTN